MKIIIALSFCLVIFVNTYSQTDPVQITKTDSTALSVSQKGESPEIVRKDQRPIKERLAFGLALHSGST